MSALREDLLHLSPEALAQVANLGLVKRALRELEGGKGPSLELDAAGTLLAIFSDGVQVSWGAGQAIQDSRCTCGAAGACRHRIMAALAYREQAEQAPPPLVSPAAVTDEALACCVPPRLLALAAAQRTAGLNIELRDTAAGEPCPTARLPAATVRFWAGANIEAARCDCIAGSACEHLVLAVWAFRAAAQDAGAASKLVCQVQLGAPERAVRLDSQAYLALVDSLLRNGVQGGAAAHLQTLSHALAAVGASGATWLQLLLADLEVWLGDYAARSARYEALGGYRLVAELALRLAAGTCPGRAKGALGIGEAQESELDRLRLIALGCRVDRDRIGEADHYHARIVLADMDTASRFVLDHHWQESGGGEPDLSRQRLAPGVKLSQLAGGQLLSRNARRRADGTLTLGKARSAQNSLLPQDGDWSSLGPPLAFSRVAELRAEKRAHPLPQAEPRHAAGAYVIFRAGTLESLFYDPHSQTVVGLLRDPDEELLVLRRSHRAHNRHGLDAMAGALGGHFGPLRQVAGVLTWNDGQAQLEPWAFACDRLVVPDTEAPCGALAGLPLGSAEADISGGPLGAVRELENLLAELLHQGLVSLGGSWPARARGLAVRLRHLSLFVLARNLEAFAADVAQAAANPQGSHLAETLLHLAALTTLHGEAGAVVESGT